MCSSKSSKSLVDWPVPLQANKPVLHCVGAPRGPAKKFCLSVWGFWNDTVEQAGLTSGAVGGVSKSLQYDKVLRYAPGLNPSSKESWLRVVRYLFQVIPALLLPSHSAVF